MVLKYIKRILHSIALVPSVLALCFLLFAIVLLAIEIDYNDVPVLRKISFTDKADVQFVLAFLIGGIFTLTIFSYTMVMNVLNRNINNYSPRLIPMLLNQKHHQVILGFTSGTIIYSMTLAVAINSPNITYFPGIAAPIGVLFGIVCVLLFIYFIHSVSQSIHINYIIKESFKRSMTNIEHLAEKKRYLKVEKIQENNFQTEIRSKSCGYLKMPDISAVGKFIKKNNVSIKLLKHPGEFVNKKEVFILIEGNIKESAKSDIHQLFELDYNVPMNVTETGFKHLVEIAVKAMSPAINDPGTALTSLDYLSQLFIERAQISDFNCLKSLKSVGFYFQIVPYKELHYYVFEELDHYLKDDPILMEYLQTIKNRIPDQAIA